jgi:PAN domain
MRLHLMALILAFGSVLPGHAVAQANTDRPGWNLKGVDANDASACERECNKDRQCEAWTFVRREHYCLLKYSVPTARKDTCCESGLKTEEQKAKDAAEREIKQKRQAEAVRAPAAAERATAAAERATKAAAGGVVLPTRAFLPPHDIPPEDFAAYGIVAFPQQATSRTIRRHISICEAFIATLPSASLATVPSKQQMVTVWPVDSASVSATLAAKPDCKFATEHYDLPTALTALKEARTEHRTFLAEGPYLLAWAPSSTKGKKDALVLTADLSDARTDVDFLNRFRAWRDEIEKKPEVWGRGGWSELDLRPLIRRWGDKWGTMILSIGRAKGQDE